jgi:hypothetical protein
VGSVLIPSSVFPMGIILFVVRARKVMKMRVKIIIRAMETCREACLLKT